MTDPFREPVTLADVDPAWATDYAAEADRIGAALAGLGAAVEHIGSTAVPLRAKPIVDIQVAVADRPSAVAALVRLGYTHHGEGGIPGRSYLTRRPRFNVHVFAPGNPVLEDNRALRDYLRANPGAGEAYVAAKEAAVTAGHDELLSYSDAKAAAVIAIRDAARAWARS